MSFKKIVVAYDASPHSKKALDWSISLAKTTAAKLHVIVVYDRSFQQMDMINMTMDLEKTFIHKFQEEIEEAVAYCKEKGVDATSEVCEGHIADTIMQQAGTQNADLIVCGTRGHGGFTNLLIGSVAHALVTYSKIPVVVVK